MRKISVFGVAILVGMLYVSSIFAAGHDVGCVECHSAHVAQGVKLLAKPANTTLLNPRDGKPITSPTSLCMACHDGSGGPEINLKSTHPVCVTPNPKIAVVPDGLLRDNQLHCPSCHDFHPSNDGAYKYLRFETKGTEGVGKFCTGCHPDKVTDKDRSKAAVAAPEKK
ncbi:MAG: cytochrome C [Candidatus Firestonebacteria bacterium]|nr:cytochrome C [Candidatus Firestonebacteria bacterium]